MRPADQPTLFRGGGNAFGLGDTNPSRFLSPSKPGKFVWSVGPTMTFPTATESELGRGKWSVGRTAVGLFMDGPWVVGALANQQWSFAGWSLYFKDGKPAHTYNFLGLQRFIVAATDVVPTGKATIRFEFAYDGGGLGTLYVNDKKVAEGRVEHTQPMIFSADETANVGEDDATPVTEDYQAYDNKFTGKIVNVTIDVKEMGAGEKAAAGKADAEAEKKIESAQ